MFVIHAVWQNGGTKKDIFFFSSSASASQWSVWWLPRGNSRHWWLPYQWGGDWIPDHRIYRVHLHRSGLLYHLLGEHCLGEALMFRYLRPTDLGKLIALVESPEWSKNYHCNETFNRYSRPGFDSAIEKWHLERFLKGKVWKIIFSLWS